MDLVFPNDTGRIMERQNLHRRHWKPLLERAGLPDSITFHALRHTFATTFLQLGVSEKTVQTWLGHASGKMLRDVYSHYIPAHGVSELDKVRGYFGTAEASA